MKAGLSGMPPGAMSSASGQDYPFHHVDRRREVMTARAAHEAGFAPRVEYAEPGLMVSAFLSMPALSMEDDVRANADRIGRLIMRFPFTHAASYRRGRASCSGCSTSFATMPAR
jgi:hypothetical protein